MKILLLGGTGAMGVPLSNILLDKGFDVYVTSRREFSGTSQLNYILGDAKNDTFFNQIVGKGWDVIIDFMAYSTIAFEQRLSRLLDCTSQYVFLSSARVYSQTESPITEETPRLLDVLKDPAYLKTDEYALSKARQENLLFDSGRENWTVIRPSITFSDSRLQLGVLEKESWLYRALHGRSIVFSDDIADKLTTMTYGLDVSHKIASIIGEPKAFGEVFHITSEEAFRWSEILDVYLSVLENKLGKRPKVVMTDKSFNLKINKYQVIYSRYFNRRFDNSKIKKITNIDDFLKTKDGLKSSLEKFLTTPSFNNINWLLEAMNDRASGEFTPLSEIPSLKMKVIYLAERFNLSFILKLIRKIVGYVKNIY